MNEQIDDCNIDSQAVHARGYTIRPEVLAAGEADEAWLLADPGYQKENRLIAEIERFCRTVYGHSSPDLMLDVFGDDGEWDTQKAHARMVDLRCAALARAHRRSMVVKGPKRSKPRPRRRSPRAHRQPRAPSDDDGAAARAEAWAFVRPFIDEIEIAARLMLARADWWRCMLEVREQPDGEVVIFVGPNPDAPRRRMQPHRGGAVVTVARHGASPVLVPLGGATPLDVRSAACDRLRNWPGTLETAAELKAPAHELVRLFGLAPRIAAVLLRATAHARGSNISGAEIDRAVKLAAADPAPCGVAAPFGLLALRVARALEVS